MSMVLSPDKKAQEAMKKAAAEATQLEDGQLDDGHQDDGLQDDGQHVDGQVVAADQEVQGATDAENEDVEDRQEAVQDNG